MHFMMLYALHQTEHMFYFSINNLTTKLTLILATHTQIAFCYFHTLINTTCTKPLKFLTVKSKQKDIGYLTRRGRRQTTWHKVPCPASVYILKLFSWTKEIFSLSACKHPNCSRLVNRENVAWCIEIKRVGGLWAHLDICHNSLFITRRLSMY